MHRYLTDMLACPLCRDVQDLIVRATSEDADHILEGALRCAACQTDFPINGGVPRFPRSGGASSVQRHFTRQWRLRHQGCFEHGTLYLSKPAASMAAVTRRLKPFFDGPSGRRILDAGCGSGDKTACLARDHPGFRVIGMDYSDSLTLSTARFRDIPNLDFIQADLHQPPFKPEVFDLAYSFGVLHHTPDTLRAFKGLTPLIAARGLLYTFIYPTSDECGAWWKAYYRFRDRIFLQRGHLLPERARYYLIKLAVWLLLSRGAAGAAEGYGLTRSQYLRAMFFTHYDNISPKYQHRHAREEVIGWYRDAGFEDIAAPMPGLYFGTRAHETPELNREHQEVAHAREARGARSALRR